MSYGLRSYCGENTASSSCALLALIERLDQRLNDRDRAVERTRVAPRFEIVSFRYVPVTELRSFVFVLTEMDTQLRFEHPVFVEFQISRRVVDRIAAEDNQQFNAAGINIANQILQRLSLIDRIHFERIGVENSLADIAQRVVHRMGERMNHRRRFSAGNHDARALVLLKILAAPSTKLEPMSTAIWAEDFAFQSSRPTSLARSVATAFSISLGLDRPLMIRARACGRRRRLNHVEPVHLLLALR